ncbi:Pvc16 family protein [Streptomyces sp. IBSNAI002]|uniref:Pvc16 family protein n=1 Tax=Streptomyces sp. IBSNAI002 TaxID=3457500 RepID=UPI003FD63B98
MILSDATDSLCRLLRPVLPDGGPVFAGSLAHWQPFAAAQQHGVGLFLHRVEEVPTGMGGDWYDLRDDAGRVVARGGPVRRFRLGYVLWTWSEHGPEEETRLLSATLEVLAAHQQLPGSCLTGALAQAAGPARLTLAPEGLTPPDGLWAAAGLAHRSTLQVALSVDLVPDTVAPAPLVEERRLRTSPTTARRVAGRGGPVRTDPRS